MENQLGADGRREKYRSELKTEVLGGYSLKTRLTVYTWNINVKPNMLRMMMMVMTMINYCRIRGCSEIKSNIGTKLAHPFYVTNLFLYPLKASENQRFCNVFRQSTKRPVR